MAQNTPLVGFIPIYSLKGHVYDRNKNNICQNIIDLHVKLRQDGRRNYVGLQISVQSKLNAEKWAAYLADYWDWQLLLLVKYSCPVDFKRESTICYDIVDHNSAIQYPNHMLQYLEEEVTNGVIAGPFTDPPITNLLQVLNIEGSSLTLAGI